MADEAKHPDKTGSDALSLLQNLSNQGISIDSVLDGLDQREVNKLLLQQYSKLQGEYNDLERQFNDLKDAVKRESDESVQRIERILALMTSNLAFIKQLINIEDVNSGLLTDQEKLNAKQELQFANLVDRQNRFTMSIANLDKNHKLILGEISKLKAKSNEHDTFKSRILMFTTIVIGVYTWLSSGDNLAILTMMTQNLFQF